MCGGRQFQIVGPKKLQKIACQSWKGRTLEFWSQYVIITDYTNLIS